MKKTQLDIKAIQTEYPRAWKDFEDFCVELHQTHGFESLIQFEQLPFEYQLGVFYRFFIENGMELDMCNVEFDMIPAVIEENFKGHNQAVAHYS